MPYLTWVKKSKREPFYWLKEEDKMPRSGKVRYSRRKPYKHLRRVRREKRLCEYCNKRRSKPITQLKDGLRICEYCMLKM